jgi:hypothetical protein
MELAASGDERLSSAGVADLTATAPSIDGHARLAHASSLPRCARRSQTESCGGAKRRAEADGLHRPEG